MFKKSKVCSGVLLALGGGVMLASLPAFAQTVDRVEITGTRIKSLGGSSNSPISSVTEAQINASQPVAVEEVIRGLPAAVPAIGPGTNNGTGGGATIDLRGLGNNRSLVLVNGRRLVPFDLNGVVDTNSVPIALLQRVDVFTGGASAVYGADAVAGVVNFVLKKNFQGVEASSSYGSSEKNDAKRRRTDITIGSALADGKGNVALSIGTTSTDPERQGKRGFGERSISSTSGNPQGSFTTVPAYLDSASISYQLAPNGDPDKINTDTFNFNPLNYYQTPLKRMQATALGNYAINDHADVYAELSYSRSNVTSNLAPSGTFFNTFSVPVGNPLMSAGLRSDICASYLATELAKAALTPPQVPNPAVVAALQPAACVVGNPFEISVDIGRRFVELGPRVNDFRNKTLQATVGVKGQIVGSWSYDAYLSRGEADQNQLLVNWGSSSKVQQALRSLDGTTCTDTSNGCVPLNVFGAAGTITPAMLNFINLSSITTVAIKQDVASVFVSGDLGPVKSPFTKQPISVAVGLEERKMRADNFSDAAGQINGEVLGTGAPSPTVQGTFKLSEVYAEAQIPLISDAPFAHSLNLDLGIRNTEFKTTGSTRYDSWKVGGDWSPVKGFRIRAMGQRATRAPNVSELFQPLITQLDNLAVDPCQGTSIAPGSVGVAGTLTNLCVLTGVPTARVGSLPQPSAGQANILSGGNPALKPEVADTLTVGFVFEPAFVPGLTVTLDYYKIDIEKAVSTPSVSDVMDDCYSAARNPGFAFNAACALVGRGPGGTFNGSSAPGIKLAQSNLGAQATSGFDLGVDYRLKLTGWGAVDVGLQLNSVDKYWFQATPTSVKRDCLGYYSVACGAPNYKQKFSQRTAWTYGDFNVGYNWRYVSKVTEEPGGTNFLPKFSTINAYSYVDLSASWQVLKNLRLSLSANNAFDKKPPEVGNTISGTGVNSGNTFPQNYDAIGRYWTVGATMKF